MLQYRFVTDETTVVETFYHGSFLLSKCSVSIEFFSTSLLRNTNTQFFHCTCSLKHRLYCIYIRTLAELRPNEQEDTTAFVS